MSRCNYVTVSLPRQERDGPLQATLNFLNKLSIWEGPGATPSLGYKLISPAQESSTTGPGFALEVISFACLPLYSSTAGPHSFQVFPPATLVICHQETLPTVGGAVTQFLASVWANQLLARQSFSFDSPNQAHACSECTTHCSADEQNPLFWIIVWALQVLTQCAEIHVLVITSPSTLLHHNQIPSG